MKQLWLKNYPDTISHELEQPNYTTIAELFDIYCDKYAEHTAFIHMDKIMRYRELKQQAYALASFLQVELAVTAKDKIAVMLPNTHHYPVITYAASLLGLIVVNINPLYTTRELLYQLKDADPRCMFVLDNVAHKLADIISESNIQHTIICNVGDYQPFPKSLLINFWLRYIKKMYQPYNIPQTYQWTKCVKIGTGQTFTRENIIPNDIALLQYTGGTTGTSKGAMLTHANITQNIAQMAAWFKDSAQEKDTVYVCLPLYHIFPLIGNMLCPLTLGMQCILITNPSDITSLVKTMKKYPANHFFAVNTLYRVLLADSDFHQLDFSALKTALSGSSPLQNAVAKEWHALTGRILIQGYGQTECCAAVSILPLNHSDITTSIGVPLPGTNIKIIDDDNLEVGCDTPGELCVKGPQVMQGYWQKEQETQNIFLNDGWIKTGDIAILDTDGFLHIVDRKKDMIISSGFNIYPNEIEAVITSHHDVQDAVAIGIADEHRGEVVKVFVVKRNSVLTAESLIHHCKKELTNYKVPSIIEFCDTIPKSAIGKNLRRALREPENTQNINHS